MSITYLKGDATEPVKKTAVIFHICNNYGGWGAGFVLALSKKWKQPETSYRSIQEYKLGDHELVRVENDIWVCNAIAQNGYATRANPVPFQYDVCEEILQNLDKHLADNVSIHMPRIGCGLGGGQWELVEPILQRMKPEREIYVYDYVPQEE